MNFSRLDDDTVRCFLSSEDLEENGLKLEDFFHNSEPAREFLQTIVERAKEEVGYEFEGGPLAMQVSPMPEDGLVITFSEKSDSFWKGLSEHLRDVFLSKEKSGIADFLEQTKTGKEADSSELIENLLRGFIESRMEKMDQKEEKKEKAGKKQPDKTTKKETPEKQFPDFLLYRFEKLEYIEKFCAGIQPGRFIKSQVYYLSEQDAWFLAVWRGRTAEANFRRFCAQALEYGMLVSDNACQMEYLKEHAECILEKDALKVLKTL
jgi:adapter protein MecA 1/2